MHSQHVWFLKVWFLELREPYFLSIYSLHLMFESHSQNPYQVYWSPNTSLSAGYSIPTPAPFHIHISVIKVHQDIAVVYRSIMQKQSGKSMGNWPCCGGNIIGGPLMHYMKDTWFRHGMLCWAAQTTIWGVPCISPPPPTQITWFFFHNEAGVWGYNICILYMA